MSGEMATSNDGVEFQFSTLACAGAWGFLPFSYLRSARSCGTNEIERVSIAQQCSSESLRGDCACAQNMAFDLFLRFTYGSLTKKDSRRRSVSRDRGGGEEGQDDADQQQHHSVSRYRDGRDRGISGAQLA
jgi:hypothetical protein